MHIPFLGHWRKKHGPAPGVAVLSAGEDEGDDNDRERHERIAELLSECELLRAQAQQAGVELDDSADSLEALDQLVPRWRDDEETAAWLGNDAGLYLGTVVVRTVAGARWEIRPNGRPAVRLASGREIDVVEAGHEWADNGAPELSQLYAEIAEG
ncbi:DUF6278 family protein [Streptomyces sp. HM190]|uniref:DUF6278 family protein n=1 Tax=Streptomyces sp. HM190 TaxID=2695266 RepID=UPI00135CD5D3|nr:DUF6278 family protein [Streptomyces sp. HM190]